jgi:hypothetical protein
MKKNAFQLLTVLSLMTFASYGVANSAVLTEARENSSIELLSENQNVNVAITPLGAIADQSKVTLHKGDEITIQGKATPDLSYNFDSVEVVAKDKGNDFINIPVINPAVLKLESNDKQTDSNFSFRYQAQEKGTSNVKLTATWKKDDNKKSVDTSIEVTVED